MDLSDEHLVRTTTDMLRRASEDMTTVTDGVVIIHRGPNQGTYLLHDLSGDTVTLGRISTDPVAVDWHAHVRCSIFDPEPPHRLVGSPV